MRFSLSILFLLFLVEAAAQTGQISIPRVEQMPDAPESYQLRDWKSVAIKYDALIFNQSLSGTHLPLVTLKPSGVNFPALQPIQLDTYVGTASETQAEAINIIPAIVGASLMGIDKSDQSGVNWVEKVKDFYNSANGQDVYLNGTNSSSGNDWWYDVMPNIFFYQLYHLYPGTSDFDAQFRTVADRWLEAVYAMGGNTTPWAVPSMNYRGWYLSTMTGNANGVREPEAAGSIAWLLYAAYSATGEKRYLEGSQLCLEYLLSLTSNPSYELQLPYGILTAARLNAETGTSYDMEKMMSWAFDRGPLRGWGAIVGSWDGQDVSGLIGEANDAGNDYAFMMNGYQQAAALAPVARYDKRFARSIAKWILNVSNASRFFYPAFRPADKQDDYAWSQEYDPESVIGYEALKENLNGKALYATGDAKRNGWAATNLALYGSSHVGYLAAVVQPTNVEKILRIDLNSTDFFADNTYSSAMFYNLFESAQQITVNESADPLDVYDAISETFIAKNVDGEFSVSIPPGEVVILTFLPAGTTTSVRDKKLYAGTRVIDHHYGYDFAPPFRIKALAADHPVAESGNEVNIFATVENASGPATFEWFVDDLPYTGSSSSVSWVAPSEVGAFEIKVAVTADGITLKDSLVINVVEIIPKAPEITGLSADENFYLAGSTARVIAEVQDAEAGDLSYEWFVPSGNFVQNDSLITWTTPEEGIYTIRCAVTNAFDLTSESVIAILVKSESAEATDPVAYYPLNSDERDYSGNNHHAVAEGTQRVDDVLGLSNFARRFSSGNDVIAVQNLPALNFRNAVTVSFWIAPGSSGQEAFIISHGSWEERWKVSITPNRKLRWTVKTENGTIDLDSTEPLTLNEFVHVTVVYTGYSMEMYLNGELDSFTGYTGLVMTTAKQITFGQKDYADRQYFYNGILDEVRIYDKALQPDEISLLQTMWTDEVPTSAIQPEISGIRIFPNPSVTGVITIDHAGKNVSGVELFGSDGRAVAFEFENLGSVSVVRPQRYAKGIHLVRVTTDSGSKCVRVLLY